MAILDTISLFTVIAQQNSGVVEIKLLWLSNIIVQGWQKQGWRGQREPQTPDFLRFNKVRP